MQWIHDYQLFLFDFDGLLVNTEEIHFKAYKNACAEYGFDLSWDFDRYCKAAHYSAEGLKEQIYGEFPGLRQKEPNWDVVYAKKKQALIELFREGAVQLMPGAKRLLEALHDAGIKRCVVTHSADDLVKEVRIHNPILETIPYWVTRHDYSHPKPHPECYRIAIDRYSIDSDNVIGFEDTARGLTALMETRAKPVLISKMKFPEITSFVKYGVVYYPSLDAIPNEKIG